MISTEKSIESSISLFSFTKSPPFIKLYHRFLHISMMHRRRRYDVMLRIMMLLRFVPQWCDVCHKMRRSHASLGEAVIIGNANIICCRQTSFKKVTFVLVDKSDFFVGTGDRNWTCTVSHWNLNPARLPVPPRLHIYNAKCQMHNAKSLLTFIIILQIFKKSSLFMKISIIFNGLQTAKQYHSPQGE